MSKSVSPNVYELELLKTYKRFYRTFPVLLLESYSRKKGEKPSGPIDLHKKDRFQIKNIRKNVIRKRIHNF
jgi:hypothetical protein